MVSFRSIAAQSELVFISAYPPILPLLDNSLYGLFQRDQRPPAVGEKNCQGEEDETHKYIGFISGDDMRHQGKQHQHCHRHRRGQGESGWKVDKGRQHQGCSPQNHQPRCHIQQSHCPCQILNRFLHGFQIVLDSMTDRRGDQLDCQYPLYDPEYRFQ